MFLREERLNIGLCESTYLIDDGPENKVYTKGIETEFVGEDQHDDDAIKSVNGRVQLVFISPESIITNVQYGNMLLSNIYKENLVALVVDDCVRTW